MAGFSFSWRAAKPGRCGRVAQLVLLALCVAVHALAEPRVAIAPLDGDDRGDMEELITDLLDGQFRIAAPRAVERAGEDLDVSDFAARKGLLRIAKELDADAIISGSVEQSGGRIELDLRVRLVDSKRTFKVLATFGDADKARVKLRKGLLQALAPLEEGGDADSDDTESDGGSGNDDSEGADDSDADDDDTGNTRGRKKRKREPQVARTRRDFGFAVAVGPSAMARQLAFATRQFDQKPQGYKSPLVPGARVAVEMYPLAFSKPHELAGRLGAAFEYEQALSLSTRTSAAQDVKMPTKLRAWSVAALFRYNIGRKPSYPTLTLGIGYGSRDFVVDRTPLPDGVSLDLPDVTYGYLEPSLRARFPLTPKAVLRVSGSFMAMRKTGAIQQMDQYGAGKVTGLDARIGVDVVLNKYLSLDIGGSFIQVGYTFQGNGSQSTSRDQDANTQDVFGAKDRYFGGAANVVAAF